MTLADAEARRCIREDLDHTLVVEAAAGTGKTTELIARIVAAIETGHARLNRIVAVTFTEKAAGEMKLRLRSAVEDARQRATGDAAVHLERALAELEAARIGTIHSFCADLLHERPVEAAVDPVFEVAAQDESARLLDQAFDTWLEGALANPPEGVRRALRRRGNRDGGPSEVLRAGARRLAEQRDFTARWTRPIFARDKRLDEIVSRLDELGELGQLADNRDDYLAQNLLEVHRFVRELRHRESVRGRDHDGLEAELRELARSRKWKWRGRRQRYGELDADQVRERRDALRAELSRVQEQCEADLAACLQSELAPVIASYEEMKRQVGKLDFLDLLLKARDLVRDHRDVRAELQERFTHLFVDEFQDTDPLQAELLLLLSADSADVSDWTRVRPRPGKLFVVGDPKQSIYRFRRADVALYQRVKEQLVGHGAKAIYLTTSFRATPAIQSVVNAAFAPLMTGQGEQAEYVALTPHRQDPVDQPPVVALSVPRPYSNRGYVTKWQVEASVPDSVGAFVHWLVERSGWTVTERDDPDARVPIAPRHICLLLKRFQRFGDDVTRDYVRALETRRVPHVLVGGRSFHLREEILAIRNALTAIEWPNDELSVYATLRGPFFALHDATLLAYRGENRQRSLHPLAPIDDVDASDAELVPVCEALGVLRELHYGRNRRPIADTITRLLDATRAHAGIAIWPHGEQALANVLRMLDLARRFESQGATSFRSFVERLDHEAAGGEASEAPVVEEGTEGVRIMTVHRAKGLEFPVVILCEPSAPATWQNPSRYVDSDAGLWAQALCGCLPQELIAHRDEALARDEEEAVRLAYVAATRARDLFVVPAVGDDPVDGWLDVLRPTLYPPLDRCRKPAPAAGVPDFGTDSVLERPASARFEPVANVAPGRHQPKAGAHTVVWWDPAMLELDKEHDVGLRQQRMLVADENRTVAQAGIDAHDTWQKSRAAALARGAAFSTPCEAVTRWSHTQSEASFPEVEHVSTATKRNTRPGGTRFGTLVHQVLATIPLDAPIDVIRSACDLHARLLGCPREEVDAAAEAVSAAITHPLMQRARAAQRCHREHEIVFRLDDGTLLEGSVDLAFLDDDGWTVVDFKTDAELGDRKAAYHHQVELYARAIATATGSPAKAMLFSV